MLIAFLNSCSDNNEEIGNGLNAKQKNYKIALVKPKEDWERMDRMFHLFQNNIVEAQKGLEKQINFELDWIDESESNWIDKVTLIAADTSYKAVIGPSTSENAYLATLECAEYNKTIILPTATSAELQRMYAGKGYAWFLSEPDIAQCEIMLSNARLYGAEGVYMLICNNSYGQTFLDWAGFQATEMGLDIYKTWTYNSAEELEKIVGELNTMVYANNEKDPSQSLLFVPSKAEDLQVLDKAMNKSEWLPFLLNTICSDIACSSETAELMKESFCDYEGYMLSASPASGFNQSYMINYGEQPMKGEAQFYDALLLLYYGLLSAETFGDTDLNSAIKRVVDGRDGVPANWMDDGIRSATYSIRNKEFPNVEGITSSLEFDAKKYTTVLHSVYSHWTLKKGIINFVGYESTDPNLRVSSTSAVWDWARSYQKFDKNINITYPDSDEQWALIVATSTSWKNYRHQADAFAMYQILKRHGYDDDHIVLIVSDSYAFNERNINPGEIRVRSDGKNVYDKKAIDYDIKDLSPYDLQDILSGKKSEKLPHVLNPDYNDNVFVFWSGHGGYNSLNWRENGFSISGESIKSMLSTLSKDKQYRQMLFAIEACYSGSIGEKCIGIPGLLMITAANSNESSWAEQRDPNMHIYLSNAFTRTFEESIDNSPDIKIRDLYYNLARTTSGSHVMVYNDVNFGNLYYTPMTVFINNK